MKEKTLVTVSMVFGLAFAAVQGCSRHRGDENSPGDSQRAHSSPERALIQNKGSDTLVNVAQAWAEAYRKVDPDTGIAVSGGGSGTGIAALINGTVDLANSSRALKPEEETAARAKGIHPVPFTAGFDALAVFLNKHNPLVRTTLEQLGKIYGERGGLEKWSQLGIKIPGCDSDDIIRVGRQNNSGTYEYFKETILEKGQEYKLGSLDMGGSKEVVDLVSKTPCAIGYSGLAYATSDVTMPCIETPGGACIAPSERTAMDKSYPLARPLFVYTSGEPLGKLKNYLDWILSDAGQCIVQKKGYAPVRTPRCP